MSTDIQGNTQIVRLMVSILFKLLSKEVVLLQ